MTLRFCPLHLTTLNSQDLEWLSKRPFQQSLLNSRAFLVTQRLKGADAEQQWMILGCRIPPDVFGYFVLILGNNSSRLSRLAFTCSLKKRLWSYLWHLLQRELMECRWPVDHLMSCLDNRFSSTVSRDKSLLAFPTLFTFKHSRQSQSNSISVFSLFTLYSRSNCSSH